MFIGRKRRELSKHVSSAVAVGLPALKEEHEGVEKLQGEMEEVKDRIKYWLQVTKSLSGAYAKFDDDQLQRVSTETLRLCSETGSIGWICKALLSYIDEKIGVIVKMKGEHAELQSERDLLANLSREWTTCRSSKKKQIQREWKSLNDKVLLRQNRLKKKMKFIIAEADGKGGYGLLSAEIGIFKQLQLVFFNTCSGVCEKAKIKPTEDLENEIRRFHNTLAGYDSSDDSEIEVVNQRTPASPVHSFDGEKLNSNISEFSIESSVSTRTGSEKLSSTSENTSQIEAFKSAKYTMLTAWEQISSAEQESLTQSMLDILLQKGKTTDERILTSHMAILEVDNVLKELCQVQSRKSVALDFVTKTRDSIQKFLSVDMSSPSSLKAKQLVDLLGFFLSYIMFVETATKSYGLVGTGDSTKTKQIQAIVDEAGKSLLFEAFRVKCEERLDAAEGARGKISALGDIQKWTKNTKVVQVKVIALGCSLQAASLLLDEAKSMKLFDKLNSLDLMLPEAEKLAATASECEKANVRKWTMDGIPDISGIDLKEGYKSEIERAFTEISNQLVEATAVDVELLFTERHGEGIASLTSTIESHLISGKEKLIEENYRSFVRKTTEALSSVYIKRVFHGALPTLEMTISNCTTASEVFKAVLDVSFEERTALSKEQCSHLDSDISAVKLVFSAALKEIGVLSSSDEVEVTGTTLVDQTLQLVDCPLEFIPVVVSNLCKDEPEQWFDVVVLALCCILVREEATKEKAAKLMNRLSQLLEKLQLKESVASESDPRSIIHLSPLLSNLKVKPKFDTEAVKKLVRRESSRFTSSSKDLELRKQLKELAEANKALEEKLRQEAERSGQLESVVENFQELFKEDLQAIGE